MKNIKANKKIMIVDDHPIVRHGLIQIIEGEGDLIICGEAANGSDAIKQLGKLLPDLVIVDIFLEGNVNGIDLVKAMRSRYPALKTLVLSMVDSSLYIERAIRAGAFGFIIKKEVTKNIVPAIRTVLAGELYLSNTISTRILSKLLHGSNTPVTASVDQLTNRELEVFQLIGHGYETREIASRLNLTIHTIESHKKNIKDKLNIKNPSKMVNYATKWVLLKKNSNY